MIPLSPRFCRTSRPVLCNYNEWLSTPRLGANSVTWRKTDGLLCQNFGARTGALWRRSPAVPFHLTQMPGFQSRGLHDQRDERAGHSSQGDTESSSRLRAHAPSWGDPQPKHPWESQESNRDNSHSSGGRGWGPLKTWTGLLGRLRGQASVTGMDARVLEQVALITVSTVLMR